MENKLKKVLKITLIVGISFAFALALILPVNFIFNIDPEFVDELAVWLNVAVYLILAASAIMSVFLIKGKFGKIAQSIISAGLFVLFLNKLLINFETFLPDFVMITAYALLVVGGAMWLISLCCKKLRLGTKSTYFFGLQILLFSLTTLLLVLGVNGLAESVALMPGMRVLLCLISLQYFAMEVNNEKSQKPLFWFAVLTFIAASFPLAITFLGI